MKRIIVSVAALLLHYGFARGQARPDTLAAKPTKTQIDVVYNHYLQNGHNSAVTGGVGTEKLTVYGPSFYIKKTRPGHVLDINTGVDFITSASTDRIDFVLSSASRVDQRYYANGNYQKNNLAPGLAASGGLGISVESDYFSLSGKAGLVRTTQDGLGSVSIQVQGFRDDLRWGRKLNPEYHKPVRLVYPKELRYREWADTYLRHSLNLKVAVTRTLNARNVLALYPELSYQQGLLSTPFHRVYFADGTEAVERLPAHRYKAALALRLHTFLLGNVILKNAVGGYADNFGIRAAWLEHETAVKLSPILTLLPNGRFYLQSRSRYFAPYADHAPTAAYYTSDYDLARFTNLTLGLGLKYSPFRYLSRRTLFNTGTLRYNYMHRSNGLYTHVISLALQLEGKK